MKQKIRESIFDPRDERRIKDVLENVTSFFKIGEMLKKLGYKVSYSDMQFPMYTFVIPGKRGTYAIVNKKYADPSPGDIITKEYLCGKLD